MSIKVFRTAIEYGDHVTEAIQELVTDNPLSCPSCLTEQFMEDNSTQFCYELCRVAKDDPKAAMSALSFMVASAHAKTVALGELMETLTELYPEHFGDEVKDSAEVQ